MKPYLRIFYDQSDITRDITESLLSFEYVDKKQGESDELSLSIENKSRFWDNSWFPDKNAILTAEFGYANLIVNSGQFSIDKISARTPPFTVDISAVAAMTTRDIRTAKTKAFERQTLAQITTEIAEKNNLEIIGDLPNVLIAREAQSHENDLQFLKRIAKKFGFVFSVKGNKLVFKSIYELDGEPAALRITPQTIISASFDDETIQTYKAAKVAYKNPQTGELAEHEATADGEESTDILEVRGARVENRQQAEIMAEAALYEANKRGTSGAIAMAGNPAALAGNNVELKGFGRFDGKWSIEESRHSISAGGGYITGIRIIRINA